MSELVLMAHPSPDLYGSDRVLLETVSGYRANDSRVVVTIPGEGPLAVALRERGAEVEFLAFPVLRKSYLSPGGLVRLAGKTLATLGGMVRLLRHHRPALLLVNTLTIPSWLLAARMAGVPAVCHIHEAEKGASRMMRKLLYLPLLMATGLVVNSRFSLDVLADSWARLARISRVVYNGVPGPARVTAPRPTLTPPLRLLFVGRLSPRKGPQVALEAVVELTREGHDVSLGLLGAIFPGYERFEADLRQKVRESGLEDTVRFIGFDPDIWSHLAHADIILVPSVADEPFGNTAVEAMLAQRPLVVSSTTGLKEAAADYGSVRRIPPDDSAALAQAVLEIRDDWDATIAHCAADRDLALRRHAPTVYQQQIVAVIADLVAGRNSRGRGRRGD